MAVAARRRLPGLKVRPGAVRDARAAAGLSLAGVAQNDVSRTAIFLIETGKSNPTLPTLELIAERTGKPVEFFLDDEQPLIGSTIDFVEIEQFLANEDFERVKDITGRLLETRIPRADAARLRLIKGIAHIRRADAEGAEPYLSGAREYYETVGDQSNVVECLSWEVNIRLLMEEPDALEFAEIALKRCRKLNPVPTVVEARILNRLAAIHAFNRSWSEAIRVYEELLELYGSLRNMGHMAHVYCELGAAYRETGQLDLSTRYSQKSIALHEMLRDYRSTAMAENNLALALMNMRNFTSAEDHLERSINLLDGMGQERGKSHVMLSLAELYLGKGSLEDAEQYAAQGLELARRNGERATEAEAWKWLAMVANAAGQEAECDARFEAAITILEDLNLTERLTRAHANYAEILEARGDSKSANTHLRQVLSMSRPDLLSTRQERIEQSMLA